MLWMSLLTDGGAGRLARKFLDRALAIPFVMRETEAGLARELEGIVLPLARSEAPSVTGALASELRMQTTALPGGGLLVSLLGDAPHTPFVVHGTGIYATPAPHQAWDVSGLQVFQVGGQTVFTRRAHHEGQQPNDFPGRALDRAMPAIEAAALAAGARVAARVWSDTP